MSSVQYVLQQVTTMPISESKLHAQLIPHRGIGAPEITNYFIGRIVSRKCAWNVKAILETSTYVES